MKAISTNNAPAALGPYSQAIVSGGFVFASGQLALDPKTGAPVVGDAASQARLAIANLQAVLEASGSDLLHVVKTTLLLADINDFAAVNAVYEEMFGPAKPARTCVAVAAVPKGLKLMVDAVAELREAART